MTPRAKNLFRGAALILLCLLLTACVEIQMRFDVRADGGGTAEWTVEIPKDSAQSLDLTGEKVKAKMAEDRQFQKPGAKVTIGRAANGNETVTVSMPFSSVAELSSNDMGFEFQKSPDGKQCTFRIKAQAQVMPIPVRAEVHMPGRVTGSNADQVSGGVARFNNIFRAEGVWVQAETGAFLSGTLVALIAGGAAALLVIVVLLVWFNKRRKTAEAAVSAATPGANYCRQCGTDNKPGAKFCRGCGGSLAAPAAPPPPPAPPVALTHCPKCNAAVAPGKKFCAACGAPLAAAPTPPPPAWQPTPAPPAWEPSPAPPAAPPPPLWEPPPAPPVPPPAWEPTPTPPPPAVPEWAAPPPKAAKSSAMMIALGASLVLLLLAIVLLAYKLLFQDRAAAPPVTPAQTAASAPPAAEAPAAEPQPGTPVTPEPAAPAPAPLTQPAQPAGTPSPATPLGRPSPMPSGSQPRTAPPAPPAGSQPQTAPPATPLAQAPPAESPPAPVTPAPAVPSESAPAPRAQILRPETTPAPSAPPALAQPAYSGPRSGYVIWSGQLEREGLVEITGGRASIGTLRGELPGVPVLVEIEPKDVGVAEAAGPQNGWKRLVLRSRNRRLSVVTIKWTVMQ